ncbi:oligodendrocyte-myelin glycoprotein [Anolis sagrei]|uniref:oligodendrocyte-myelin glycoprotein n=1 Tax=Anolis sagrei TaxID=38937 RepID=UPI003521BD76
MENRVLKAPPCVLALLFILPAVQGICPSVCSCSGNDRNVDCSGGNLTTLPHGLQNNITYLNLSHNHLVDLDRQLTKFTNLRTLDLSHNWLQNLPAHLPRSLWEIYAAYNNIRVLQKLDTAYQWNLKVLDVSRNMVERAVLINNTMSSLRFLNLSSNKLWTVPTNIPYNTETVDLSDNFLTQILPGTLMRLTHLSKFYLHNNKFTYIPEGAFDQLVQLQLITLYNNPWACGDDSEEALSYLQKWVEETSAMVLGSPCSFEATTYLPTPTTAENPLLVKAMKALHTAGPPVATEQTRLVHQQFRMKDISLSATVGRTIAFTSTGRPLSLHPEGLSTEKLSSYEAAAAGHTIYIQDTSSLNASTIGLAGLSTTPMTLGITGGMPTNYSKRPQSTTTVKREESTKKINPRAPSKATASERCWIFVVMLAVVSLEMGYGFVLK